MTYQAFFNLDDAPFGLTPDPQYYFPSKRHDEALETLLYCVESGEGFAQITGQPGVGKTLLIRSFLDQLGDNVNTALILHPRLEAEDLFRVILEDLGLVPENMQGMSKESLLRSFRDILLESAEQGQQTLVIIDEAQEIPEKTLEELRLLSNLETNKTKLLQIILVGQLELEDKLNQENFKQLRQRITICYRLDPLTLDETMNYIHHRLKIAGGGTISRFSPKIIKQIHKISKGIPRIINTLCERSLMAAFVDGKSNITYGHLHNAAQSLGHNISRTGARSGITVLAVSLTAILILGGIAAYFTNATVQRMVTLKTRQLITYWQTKTMDFGGSSKQPAVLQEDAKEEPRESNAKTVQEGQAVAADNKTGQHEASVLIVQAAEKDPTLNAEQRNAATAAQEDADISAQQAGQHDITVYKDSSFSESAQNRRESHVSQVEEIPTAPAKQQAASETTENPVALPPGWSSIIIRPKKQQALFFRGGSHGPFKELTLPKPTSLEDGIYLLGQDKGKPFLFNHRSFFAWQLNLSLAGLLLQQFAEDRTPAVIPVIVLSTDPDTSTGQNDISEIKAMVQNWAAVHAQKNIKKLMHYYDDSLISYKLFNNTPTVQSHAQVEEKKASIFKKNKAVLLQISDPVCLVNTKDPSQAIALFHQRFVSSTYHDSGIKVLYLRKTGVNTSNNAHWLITGNLWLATRENKEEPVH